MIIRIVRADQGQLLTSYALTAAANLAGQLYCSQLLSRSTAYLRAIIAKSAGCWPVTS